MAFGLTQLTRNLPAALRDLGHADPEVRASAARDLRHASERERALAALADALRDPAGVVRAAAAESLADLRGKEALAALLAVADGDEDAHARQMALLAIGAIGEASACEIIERALGAHAPEVRFQAVIAFARCASRDRAVAALLRALGDPDPLIAHIALRMAEELGGGQQVVEPPILERARTLLKHADPVVRVGAAIIRARAGHDDGHETLVAVARGELRTSQAEDEAAAIELCGELGLRDAEDALVRRGFSSRLGLGGDRFAWQARVALAQLGHERAVRWILRELSAWTRERRTLAVAAAGRAHLEAARPALLAMRGDIRRAEPDAVEDALRAIEGTAVHE